MKFKLIPLSLCPAALLALLVTARQPSPAPAEKPSTATALSTLDSGVSRPSGHDEGNAQPVAEKPAVPGDSFGPSYTFLESTHLGVPVHTAENFSCQMQVRCHPEGITITPSLQHQSTPAWRFSLTNPLRRPSPLTAAASKVTYHHSPSQEEWFINSEKGIEHGMTLATAPSSTQQPLRLEFRVVTGLHGKQVGDNHLMFKNDAGVPTLRYEKLFAYDAKGRDIPTALAWNGANSTISWQVDHQGFDYPITIDPVIATFSQTLLPPSLIIGTFGDSIATVGNFMAVGAPSSSRVYLYEKNAGTWEIFSRKNFLVSPATNGGAFGSQVLMPDMDTIIVSDSSFDAPTATGSTNINQGAVFVFGRNTGGDNNWGLIRQITLTDSLLPNGKLADRLGSVMACAGDTLAASAIPDQDSYDTAVKSIYLFEKDRGGLNNWGQVPGVRIQSLNFSSGFTYATTFDLSGDLLVVGSAAENYLASPGSPTIQFQGAVYLYGRNQGGVNQWGLLPNGRRYAPDGQFGDFFGRSVSISGHLISIGADGVDFPASQSGAGGVYLLARDQGGTDAWGFLPGRLTAADAAASDNFGAYVKLRDNVLAVRASGDDVAGTNNAGSVYLFERSQGGTNTFGAVTGGKFSIDNVSNIIKVNSPVFLSEGHLVFATDPSIGNSSVSIVNLSGTIGPEAPGPIRYSPQGTITFIPSAAGSYQLRSSINLTTWANQGAAQSGPADTSLIWNAGTPGAEPKRFYRVERP